MLKGNKYTLDKEHLVWYKNNMRLSEFMTQEHELMDTYWEQFMAESDKEKSKELFRKFCSFLSAHIKLEEGTLEQIVSERLGIEKEKGPAIITNHDHHNLAKLLELLSKAIQDDDAKEIKFSASHFRRALTKHHEREVDLHYKLFDAFISADDWKIILREWGHSAKK